MKINSFFTYLSHLKSTKMEGKKRKITLMPEQNESSLSDQERKNPKKYKIATFHRDIFSSIKQFIGFGEKKKNHKRKNSRKNKKKRKNKEWYKLEELYIKVIDLKKIESQTIINQHLNFTFILATRSCQLMRQKLLSILQKRKAEINNEEHFSEKQKLIKNYQEFMNQTKDLKEREPWFNDINQCFRKYFDKRCKHEIGQQLKDWMLSIILNPKDKTVCLPQIFQYNQKKNRLGNGADGIEEQGKEDQCIIEEQGKEDQCIIEEEGEEDQCIIEEEGEGISRMEEDAHDIYRMEREGEYDYEQERLGEESSKNNQYEGMKQESSQQQLFFQKKDIFYKDMSIQFSPVEELENDMKDKYSN